jgi:hypothetical protein
MKRLRHIETLRGTGILSGESIEPITIGYDLVVGQWVHQFESADGASESPGTYHMEITLTAPASATKGIISLVAAGTPAELVLQDGRKAEVLVSNTGSFLGTSQSGRIRCHVNSLEGYG